MNAKDIAGRLTKTQRDALVSGYALGRKTVPKVIEALSEQKLVYVLPAMMGWAWKPTPLGLAVREAIMQEEG